MADRASQVKANEVREPSFWISKPSRPLPRTKNFRGYIAEDQALQDRSNAEIRLHEAIEEIYGPDDPLEALIDQLYPEKPKETITLPIVASPTLYQISVPKVIQDHATTEAQTPDPVVNTGPVQNQTILDFDKAKAILVPLIDELQGKVTVSDFEDASKFFLEFGSKDIDEVYLKEKQLTRQVPLGRLQQGILEIQSRVRSGGSEAKVLQRALKQAGLDVNSLNTKQADNTFSSNFAKIYFFLKELAPKEMPDGTVFDTLAKPLFDDLLSKAKTIVKPKKPTTREGMTASQRRNIDLKLKSYPRKLQEHEAALAKSIPEIYNFIIEKLGGVVPEVIRQRLQELS